jgi:GAG-pre-integrase domain
MSSNLYIMDIQTVAPERVHITKVTIFPCDDENSPAPDHLALLSETSGSLATLDIWHHHLGHVSSGTILRMAREGLVNGMVIMGPTDSTSICKTCLVGKQSCIDISKSTNMHTTKILRHVFLDICGKLLTQSHQKFEYFATFTNDKSCKVFVARQKLKSNLLDQLKIFIARVKRKTGKQLKILWSYSSGEYTSNAVTKFFEEHSIKQEITTADTPQHNGVVEHMNHILLDKVRTMLTDVSLPNSFWYDALEYAAILHNSLPTKPLPDVTLEEAWSGNKPDILQLHLFGCKAHVHIPKDQRLKLSMHLHTCIFLGLMPNYKAFKLINHATHKIYNSCDILFDEGGTTPHECVIIDEHNDDNDTGCALAPAPPHVTPVESTPRPKCATHALVHDNNPCYDVSSYKHKSPMCTSVTEADLGSDPCTFDKAMA